MMLALRRPRRSSLSSRSDQQNERGLLLPWFQKQLLVCAAFFPVASNMLHSACPNGKKKPNKGDTIAWLFPWVTKITILKIKYGILRIPANASKMTCYSALATCKELTISSNCAGSCRLSNVIHPLIIVMFVNESKNGL
jgi:hypothetical protein